MTKTLSLADLNARKAAERAYEFEYTIAGEPTGFFISVLGADSEIVTGAMNTELNDLRRRNAIAAARAAKARPGQVADFEPVEDDIAFGRRLAAVRICGWRGLTEDYTPERALQLVNDNPDVAAQVLEASNTLENFMRPSSTK